MSAATAVGDGIIGYVRPDPSGRPNEVLFKLNNSGDFWREGSIVAYQDAAEAKRVFNTLKHSMSGAASPICFKKNLIIYERCSDDAYCILAAQGFPLQKTWKTLRSVISAMLDMHEWGVGGLPAEISDFVRMDRWDHCKLYYASTRRERCGTYAQWHAVVQQDYLRMEIFLRKLIHDELPNSMDLMKSEALFGHFLDVLREYSTKSYGDRQKHRSLVLGHPLLMSYAQIKRLLYLVGPRGRAAAADAIRKINDVDWITNANCASNWRFHKCLSSKRNHYRGSYFLEFCYDLMFNANEYNMYQNGFTWPWLVQQFEEFYPSYFGLLWAALEERGVCPEMGS